MSVNANAVMTLAEAKAWLKLTTADTTRDGVVESFINQLSDYLEDLLQNPVIVQDKLDYLDGSGGEELHPSFFPFVELVGATDQAKLDNLQCKETFNSAWVDLFSALTQFVVIKYPEKKNFPQYLQRLDSYVFPDGIKNIRLFYRAGYEVIPGTIMTAAYEMLHVLWHGSPYGDNRIGKVEMTSSVQGQNATTKLKDMDKRWKELLAEYIRE